MAAVGYFMNGPPEDAWVARAEEDWRVTAVVLRRKRPLTAAACFHAQQCAEKYFKAILVAHGHAFPKTHDLVFLQELCHEAGVIVAVARDALDLLSRHAVLVRYPGDDPSVDVARAARETARSVRVFARRWLGVPRA